MSENFTDLSEEQQAVSMPYFIHEGEMSRMERLNKRWFVAFLIAILMLFITNAGWIIYESQFETVSYEQEVRSDKSYAMALLNTGEGSINYNDDSQTETDSESQEDQQPESYENLP